MPRPHRRHRALVVDGVQGHARCARARSARRCAPTTCSKAACGAKAIACASPRAWSRRPARRTLWSETYERHLDGLPVRAGGRRRAHRALAGDGAGAGRHAAAAARRRDVRGGLPGVSEGPLLLEQARRLSQQHCLVALEQAFAAFYSRSGRPTFAPAHAMLARAHIARAEYYHELPRRGARSGAHGGQARAGARPGFPRRTSRLATSAACSSGTGAAPSSPMRRRSRSTRARRARIARYAHAACRARPPRRSGPRSRARLRARPALPRRRLERRAGAISGR